jgi:hypothetical protein
MTRRVLQELPVWPIKRRIEISSVKTIIENAIFEALTAVLLETRVFWGAMPYRFVNIYIINVGNQSKARST